MFGRRDLIPTSSRDSSNLSLEARSKPAVRPASGGDESRRLDGFRLHDRPDLRYRLTDSPSPETAAWFRLALKGQVVRALCRGILSGAVAIGAAFALALPAAAEWSWGQAAPLPSRRTEVSAASDGTFVYVLGGFGENRTAPTEVYRFDPAGGWSVIANLPEGVNHAGLVAADGKLYLVGGYRGATFDPVANLRILDLATFAWSEGAPMPTARGALAVALLDGKIHALGGTADQPDSLTTHEVYDPATNSWTSRAPFTLPRNHHTAASFEGEIFIFGGRDPSTYRIAEAEAYDPATDTWRAIAPMPTGRSGIASAVVAGRIVVFGGESSDLITKTFNEAEAYDPATDTWETLPPMPIARHGLGAAALGDAVHVISGGPRPGFTFSDVHSVLTYAP